MLPQTKKKRNTKKNFKIKTTSASSQNPIRQYHKQFIFPFVGQCNRLPGQWHDRAFLKDLSRLNS